MNRDMLGTHTIVTLYSNESSTADIDVEFKNPYALSEGLYPCSVWITRHSGTPANPSPPARNRDLIALLELTSRTEAVGLGLDCAACAGILESATPCPRRMAAYNYELG